MTLGVYSMEAVSILSQHSRGDKISYKNLPVKGLRCINVLSTKLLSYWYCHFTWLLFLEQSAFSSFRSYFKTLGYC